MLFTLHRVRTAPTFGVFLSWVLFGPTQMAGSLAAEAGSGSVDIDIQTVAIHGSWAGTGVARALMREFASSREFHALRFIPADSDQIPGRLAGRECDLGLVLDSLAPSVEKTRPGMIGIKDNLQLAPIPISIYDHFVVLGHMFFQI